jgi:hypothetical protein
VPGLSTAFTFNDETAMSDQVFFTCTALPQGKKGVLPKDENGYYTFPVGGLDVFNSSGDFYTLKGSKRLFEESSLFMRRTREGLIYGEAGHPEPLPNQSFQDFARRVMRIEEKNVAVHYSDFWLDFDSMKDESGKSIIAIMAKLKPEGPFGAALESSLNNPKINTCFSIRSFTDDQYKGGTLHRSLTNIITFDHVIESGIRFARKYNAPALESLVSVPMHRKDLLQLVQDQKHMVAMESSTQMCLNLFEQMGWSLSSDILPHVVRWK